MPDQAFVLIETRIGAAKDVVASLRRMQSVKEVSVIIGPYDVIARVEAEGVEGILAAVRNQVQQVPGIRRTLTCVAIPDA